MKVIGPSIGQLPLDKTSMLTLAAFIAPVAVTLIAPGFVHKAPPLTAQPDATPIAQPERLTMAGVKPSSVQLAAEHRANELSEILVSSTPLYYPAAEQAAQEPVVVAAQEPVAQPAPEPPRIAPPEFSVSSIIRAADGQSLAIVNSKMRRVGDDLGKGWKLTAINVEARRITVSHNQAKPVVIALAVPGGGGASDADE